MNRHGYNACLRRLERKRNRRMYEMAHAAVRSVQPGAIYCAGAGVGVGCAMKSSIDQLTRSSAVYWLTRT